MIDHCPYIAHGCEPWVGYEAERIYPSRRQDFVSSKWQFYNPDYLTPAGLAGIPSPAELERGRFGKKPW